MEILRIARQNESLTRSFSPPQCGQAFLPVHLASNTGGTWLTTFSIAKSRKPIKNLSTGLSLLFFGRKTKAALVGIPALLGMPIFLSRRYAPVFEVEPRYRARGRFMKKMCERAGVKPFGFHALRHLHASLLYNEGAELSVVQRQLRHTNPNTTARYLRSLGYEEEHSQKVLAVLEGRGRGKVIPFPQKQNPQRANSRGSVHKAGTQLTTQLKANGA